MIKLVVILLALTALPATDALFWRKEIIDEATSDIKAIAQTLCTVDKGYDRQIGHFATIHKLVEFFQTLPAEDSLEGCRQKYGESLEQLQEVLSAGDQNVCGDEQIKLIERFHQRYITRVKKYRDQQEANHWRAPLLAQLFFMHYASRVSTICERSAISDISQMAEDSVDEKTKEESEKFASRLSDSLAISDLSHGYDSVFLLWSLIDQLPIRENEKFSQYLSDGPSVRVTISMHNASVVHQLQDACNLRPSYARSLLPLIKLVNLGYYPNDGLLVEEVRRDPTAKLLFTMSQLCELLSPIKAVTDPALLPNQIVMLPKDESHQENVKLVAGSKAIEQQEAPLIDKNSMHDATVKVVEATRKHDQGIKMVLGRMINLIKGNIQKNLGPFFLADKRGSLEPMVEEDLSLVDEKNLEALVEPPEELPKELSRKKRNLAQVVRTVVKLTVATISACLEILFGTILSLGSYAIIGIYSLYFRIRLWRAAHDSEPSYEILK